MRSVFNWLHALVRKGYVPDIGTSTGTEIIILRHAGKPPDLVLYGNGVVEGLDGHRPRHKRAVDAPPSIAAEGDAEHLRFMKFLDSVPPASLRDRTRRWRQRYLYLPAVLVTVWLICVMLTVTVFDY